VRADGTTIVREGSVTGEARSNAVGEAHEIALKAAETDATKRALTTFGKPFGLALSLNGRSRTAPEHKPQGDQTMIGAPSNPGPDPIKTDHEGSDNRLTVMQQHPEPTSRLPATLPSDAAHIVTCPAQNERLLSAVGRPLETMGPVQGRRV
jgi:hypothetical protein